MMPTDVFISYSHKDADWVRGVLVQRLEERGFSLAIDYRDFKTGSMSVEQMQVAIENCRHVIVVLTPEYLNSDWSRFENVMAQTLDPGASERKIIPVLREKCNMPLRIRILHYRDMTAECDDEWERLIRDLM